MGGYDNRLTACAVCGAETGGKDGRKHAIKDAFICPDCYSAGGYHHLDLPDDLDAKTVQKEIEFRKNALAEYASLVFDEEIPLTGMKIDTKAKRWIQEHTKWRRMYKVFKYEDVADCRLLENGVTLLSVKKEDVKLALTSQGDENTTAGENAPAKLPKPDPVVYSLCVRATVNHPGGEVMTIPLIGNEEVPKDSDTYAQRYASAKELVDTFIIMMADAYQ